MSVTHCPLTGTAMGFERGGTTFGVSGKLVNSNLVMYDRATDGRCPRCSQPRSRAPLLGTLAPEFSVTWTTWKRWRHAHPDTLVLTEDTGHIRATTAADP